jgi:hypothetical protein
MTRRDDRGSITALVASVTGGLVLLTVLVAAGSEVLRARSDAFGLAAAAARAGAQELDEAALVEGALEIDPAAATTAAEAYLADRGATGTVTVAGDQVIVTVGDAVTIDHLGQVIDVSATATVTATRGTTP